MRGVKFSYKKFLIYIILILFIIYNIVAVILNKGNCLEQLVYIAIILVAYFFKENGIYLVAIIADGIIDLFNISNNAYNLLKIPNNLVSRLVIYILIGIYFTYLFKQENEEETPIEIDEEEDFVNNVEYIDSIERLEEKDTIKNAYLIRNIKGLYNLNKLYLTLKSFHKKKINYHIAIIKIKNLDELCKCYDFDIITPTIDFLVNLFTQIDHYFDIYPISHNAIIILKKKSSLSSFKKNLFIFLGKTKVPMKFGNCDIRLILKTGIINDYNLWLYTPSEILSKLMTSIEQNDLCECGLYLYNEKFASERKLYNEVANSLIQAMEDNNFYLLYQPIIDIRNNEISNCEVLVRWDRPDDQLINTSTFIKVAEEFGIIKSVTKWVFENAINNYFILKYKGVEIKYSINISVSELLDEDLLLWIDTLLIENDIPCKNFELEITERISSKDNNKLKKVVSELKNKGYIIKIDDFGTGYNSLKFINEIPSDVIKIDKYFVDKIYEDNMKIIVEKIISAAHKIGFIVIAEGVEDKEQYKILEQMSCDKIQGYYFSKPLKLDDFYEYYKTFNLKEYD
ncbi:MAG: EAL domain-containing protein [Pleomorphochaeta sp.]